MGKPLFKVAALDSLLLKAYISETQLSEIKIGQKVRVVIDAKNNSNKVFQWQDNQYLKPGRIYTKDCADKGRKGQSCLCYQNLRVPNDGSIKIGMPADVHFSK